MQEDDYAALPGSENLQSADRMNMSSILRHLIRIPTAILIYACFASVLIYPPPLFANREKGARTDSRTTPEKKKGENREKKLNQLEQMILFDASTERRQGIKKVTTLKENERERFIPILLKLSRKDLDPFVREASLRALTDMKIKSGEETYINALNDEKEDVRRIALNALSAIDSKKGDPVFELIKKEEFKTHSRTIGSAIRLLGKMKYSPAVPFLKEKADDPQTQNEHRGSIILYFGNVGAKEMTDYLVTTASDDAEEMTIRSYAVNALGKLGDSSVIAKLKKIYDTIRVQKNKQERAKYSSLKLQLITALLRLGDDSVEDELIASAKDDDANVRYRAITQIGSIKLTAARELLEYKSKHDPSTRVKSAAKKALEKLEGKSTPHEDEIDDEVE